jgi:radical SAM-linked protein
MRAIERAVRRAELPYAVTQGFNPHMKLAFGPALPVGTAGTGEYVDVFLKAFVPPAELAERLLAASPPSLAPVAVKYVADAEPSLSAALELATYETEVEGTAPDVVGEAVQALVAAGTLDVATKKGTRTFRLDEVLVSAPKVTSLTSKEGEAEDAGGARVVMTVRIGERGSMRPDDFVRAALDATGAVKGRLVTTRTGLAIGTDDGPVPSMLA